MKSKTSSYKGTWFRKNIVRFAPFWVLYTLCLFLGLAMMFGDRDGFYHMMNLSECARFMAVVNCGYALVTAQLLFGDLYSSRMCFGIHALPLRREEIFGLNLLSGLLFSLVPTALMTLCAMPAAIGSSVERGSVIPLLWFAAANLQYFFFFSLAVFCAFLAGSRFSVAVLYGILNSLSLLLYLLVETMYMPLLPGVSNPFEWFRVLCPVGKIAVDPLLILTRKSQEMPGTFEIQGKSWAYLLILAAIGLLLLGAALQLYRKRNLETAGEFIAVKSLKPVFLVLFSVFGAMGLNLTARVFFGYQERTAMAVSFSLIGLIAGWFVGLMLLKRTARVFSAKAFLGIGTLLILTASSLLLTHLDLFHVASWVPEPEQVEAVYLIPGYDSFGEYWTGRENYKLTASRDLEAVTEMHRMAIGEGLTPADATWYYDDNPENLPAELRMLTVPVSLEYHMKDGSLRRRYYYIYADSEAGALAEGLFSRPSLVLEDPDLLKFREAADRICVNGYCVPEDRVTRESTVKLLEAIALDFQEGNLAQLQEFHPVPVWAGEETELPDLYLSVNFSEESWDPGLSLSVYSDSIRTLRWMQDQGVLEDLICRILEEN